MVSLATTFDSEDGASVTPFVSVATMFLGRVRDHRAHNHGFCPGSGIGNQSRDLQIGGFRTDSGRFEINARNPAAKFESDP